MLAELKTLDIKAAAREMWKENLEAEPHISAVYLFPSEEEIRLVHIDPTAAPNGDERVIRPFYFGTNRAAGVPYRSAIAFVRPDEKDKLVPPAGWGDWSQAEKVWPSR